MDASTVMEHVGSFAAHSRRRIWQVNTDLGFPPRLAQFEFRAVIIHYCVFGMGDYRLSEEWLEYLDRTDAYKIAFFQDECTRCQRRFRFLNEHAVDCVYTCLEPSEFPKVYGRYTNVAKARVECALAMFARTAGGAVAGSRSRMRQRPSTSAIAAGRFRPTWAGAPWRSTRSACASRSWRPTAACVSIWRPPRRTASTATTGIASWRLPLRAGRGVRRLGLRPRGRGLRTSGSRCSPTAAGWAARSRGPASMGGRRLLPHDQPAAFRGCRAARVSGAFRGPLLRRACEPMVHYIPLAKDFSNLDRRRRARSRRRCAA